MAETSASPGAGEKGASNSVVVVGDNVGSVNVSIGPQFLQLFSEQLYSSPNKAFEELVSNSWDAGASAVHIGMAEDLTTAEAAVWVLDNGESMDLEGIGLLWSVAFSTKPTRQAKRPQIGKFGIGKLATYLLAHQLTYVCRAADGVIRAVTMDYRDISRQGDGLHIKELPLPVRRIDEADLPALLKDVSGAPTIISLINNGVPPAQTEGSDEFGPGDGGTDDADAPHDTWTLVILSDLKPGGRNMEVGRIRRMLRTALPLGDSISIVYCGEPLPSTKVDVPVKQTWTLGPGLGIATIELSRDDQDPEVLTVEEHNAPYPHLTVEGIPGKITGTVRLYEESIAGGKSSQVAASNGFFVNIVGRVINPTDPYFGLSNLNHSAWAKMRAAVRVDGLNHAISVDRESVIDERSVSIFRSVLRSIFNKVRAHQDDEDNASWPDAGSIMTKAWGTVPLDPLRRVLNDRFAEHADPPPFITLGDSTSAAMEEWQPDRPPADLVTEITFVNAGPDAPLVRYDPADRTVVVNGDHPFAREHGDTHEQQLLLRDASFVDLLTQAYMLELGVHDETLAQIETYRDQLLRLVARIRRRSGAQLAELLDVVTNDPTALEHAVTEALEYLGFVVTYISGKGEPEGIAAAPLTPGKRGARRQFTFTYDAKSSRTGRVANGDVRVSTLARHRDKYEADHVLVVAPDFESGALEEECARHSITPMRARALSALLLLQATYGPIDLEELRDVFALWDPNDVDDFVEDLAKRMKEAQHDRLSFDLLFDALGTIGYQEPDTLTTDVIAREIRKATGIKGFPKNTDVQQVIAGLSVLAPHLIRANGNQVFLGAEPRLLRDAFVGLLARVPARYSFVKPS